MTVSYKISFLLTNRKILHSKKKKKENELIMELIHVEDNQEKNVEYRR
jgi:hypothetical protein